MPAGSGRTLKVTPPGGAGFTSYVYQGATVKVLEPNATRWKLLTMDGFGNLIQVKEPNPAGGGHNYGSNVLNIMQCSR